MTKSSEDWMRRQWQWIREKIDASLVRGQLWFLVLLAVAAFLVAVLAAAVLTVFNLDFGRGKLGLGQATWQTLTRTLDPGQITEDRGGAAFLMLAITLVGLLLLSTLISLVNNKVQWRVEEADRGRRPSSLKGHIVILGWSEISLKVLEQLFQSGEPRRPRDVLILAQEPVRAMQQRIDEFTKNAEFEKKNRKKNRGEEPDEGDETSPPIFSPKWPRLRTGNPSDQRDLRRLASAREASAIIVLSPDGTTAVGVANGHSDELRPEVAEAATAEVVKAVLAIVAVLETKPPASSDKPKIVAEFAHDPKTAALLKKRLKSHADRIVPVTAKTLRASLAAQVSHCPGLAEVYADLFDFEGNEFHVISPPPGIGTFGQAVNCLEDASAIGVVHKAPGQHSEDGSRSGSDLDLWPARWDERLEADDQLLVLMNDAGQPKTLQNGEPISFPRRPGVESRKSGRVLVVGWNDGALGLIEGLHRGLDSDARSCIHIVTTKPVDEELESIASPERVARVEPGEDIQKWLSGNGRTGYDHAIILTDESKSPGVADVDTLLAFLAFRPPGEKFGNPETVVAELQQRRSKHLVVRDQATDFIVTGALTADALAQYAVNPKVADVFDQLLGDSEFELDFVKPDFGNSGEPFNFREVVRGIAKRGEIALGYRENATPDSSDNYKLTLNPTKSETIARDDLLDVLVLARRAKSAPIEV